MTGKCEYDGQVGQGHERMKRTAVGRWGRGGGQIQVDRGNTTRAPRTRVRRVLTSIRDTGERETEITAQFLMLSQRKLKPAEKPRVPRW